MTVKKSVAKDTTEETRETEQKIDTSRLRRRRAEPIDEEIKPAPLSVSAAVVEKALDLAFVPSREMLPSVTVIDRFQGRLFPIIDLINVIWDDVLQVAAYRQDKDEYKRVYKRVRPVSQGWLDELLHRTALWQKSIGGLNLSKITDIALAEKEAQAGEEGDGVGGVDAWGKE